MKFFSGYSEKLLTDTLGVIFNVPNTKWVGRYLRRWKVLQKELSMTKSEMEKQGLSFDIMKLNKEIQAEWFQGPTIKDPLIPLEYLDEWNLIASKTKLLRMKSAENEPEHNVGVL